MSTNKVSAEIPQETENVIMQHIADVTAQLPWLVSLHTAERLRLVKMGHKYVDFVDTSLIRAQSHGKYLTNASTLEEFTKDVNLRDRLNRLYEEWNTLGQKIKDTILLVESEAYQAARLYYKSVKAYAQEGDPEAEQIAKELARYHKKKRPEKEEKTENNG